MPTYLRDLLRFDDLSKIRKSHPAFRDVPDAFLMHPTVSALGWPRCVVRQWLWEHAAHEAFLSDYGAVDLASIEWSLEDVSTDDLMEIETGPSELGCIDNNAAHHQHWVSLRTPEVGHAWEESGTWLVAPILIARSLLDFEDERLQLVEGRTRVGIMRGRSREHLNVAEKHKAWVGRRRT